MRDSTGASNENCLRPVLASEATDRVTTGISPDTRPLLKQPMDVYEIQVTVAERRSAISTVGDTFSAPKFKPFRTSACPPDGGELYGTTLVTTAVL
jgi:hypothetical protein